MILAICVKPRFSESLSPAKFGMYEYGAGNFASLRSPPRQQMQFLQDDIRKSTGAEQSQATGRGTEATANESPAWLERGWRTPRGVPGGMGAAASVA